MEHDLQILTTQRTASMVEYTHIKILYVIWYSLCQNYARPAVCSVHTERILGLASRQTETLPFLYHIEDSI